MLLSIIIPSYNVENYISKCLKSVFDQIDERVEVILVDDGSTDATLHVVLSDFSSYIRAGQLNISIQSNSGPGASRNKGLEKCNGKYITFLDSDDFLIDDYYREIAPLLEKNLYDIVEHGFIRFHNNKNVILEEYRPMYLYNGSQNLQSIRNNIFAKTVWYPSIRIYRSNVWTELRYPEGVFYEDPMTIHKIFLFDYSIFFTGKPFLAYRFNPNGITSRHTGKHMKDLINFYYSLTSDSSSVLILKIRLARSLLFFYHELNLYGEVIENIKRDVENFPKSLNMLRNLSYIDMFFLLFTQTYSCIDKLRLTLRRNRQ